jgi:23S rRNA-/tRNA-specific pseudouridylate synthase
MTDQRHDDEDESSTLKKQSTTAQSKPLPAPPTKLTTDPSPIEGRLDAALRAMYALSHKAARRLITTYKVSVDGVGSYRWETQVSEGSLITINPSAPNLAKQKSLGAQLIFQDDAFAVINKPAGLLSAPQRDSDEPSALQAASRLCKGPRRPRVVHRLDKETSGLLIFARTIPATRALQVQLQERDIKRVYRCIVRGEVKDDRGYLSSWLLRDAGKGKRGSRFKTFSCTLHRPQRPEIEEESEEQKALDRQRSPYKQPQGQWALTSYKVASRQRGYTALEVELFTGRTHQIRVHLAELGHPIVGEWVYGPRVKREPRLALHAARLDLTHPFAEKRLSFEAPWPDELQAHPGVPRAWKEQSLTETGQGTQHEQRDASSPYSKHRSSQPNRHGDSKSRRSSSHKHSQGTRSPQTKTSRSTPNQSRRSKKR